MSGVTTFGGVSISYDAEDRLTSITTLPSGAFSATYRDDGLRASKSSVLNGVHYYLYDGGQVVCEINSSGTPLIFYGYGASGLSEKYDANAGITYAYTFDPAGNVVERHQSSPLINPSDWVTLYDAFGGSHAAIEVNGQHQTNQVNIESVGFGGQWGYYTDNEIDQVTGVVPQGRLAWTLNGQRYYDPATGRFLTRDPVGYEGGINLYTFCGNNPINYADPSGTQSDDNSGVDWDNLTMGNGLKGRKVNPEINKQIMQPMSVVLHTAAELHPFAPLGNAIYGRDSYNHKLSNGARLFNGLMAIAPLGASTALKSLSGFKAVGGMALEEEVAAFLSRKGAQVIRGVGGKDLELSAVIQGVKYVGQFDGQIGRTLYQVKGVVGDNPNTLAKVYQQLINQSRVAGALGQPYRVLIKGPVPSNLVNFMSKHGIRYLPLN